LGGGGFCPGLLLAPPLFERVGRIPRAPAKLGFFNRNLVCLIFGQLHNLGYRFKAVFARVNLHAVAVPVALECFDERRFADECNLHIFIFYS
jgi:hypothetical protein